MAKFRKFAEFCRFLKGEIFVRLLPEQWRKRERKTGSLSFRRLVVGKSNYRKKPSPVGGEGAEVRGG